jgi:hypothetical protein
MNLLRELRLWAVAVFKEWYGWAGGSFLSVVLLFGQSFWNWQPSRLQVGGIFLAGLLWSMFSAWSAEHRARLTSQTIRGNRPFVAERSFKKEPTFGLTVTNLEYAACEVRISPVPIGDSGYVLHFDGVFAQLRHGEEAFFPMSLHSLRGDVGRDGRELFEVMRESNVVVVNF